ncbi:MAG: AsmA family protein [Pseudomonadota bacterium]
MGKLLKFILWLVVSLIALVAIAVVVLPMVVDPNDYKEEIAKAVEEQTGRTLTIAGDIELSVFPWLGLDIGPTQFSNAAGFDEPAMASMETVQVRVKLLPLLRKQLEVDKVQLSGLQLYLAKDKNGQTNWADLTGATETGDSDDKDKAVTPAAPGSEGGGLDRLTIGGIEITDASIHWDDQSTGSRYVVNDLSLTTGTIEPGEAFELDLQLQLASTQPVINTGLSLGGELLIAADFSAVTVTDARLQVDARGDSLPAGQMNATLTTDIALGLAAQTLSLPNIELDTLGLHITGSVSGTDISSEEPRFNGSLAMAGFEPRKVLQALGEEALVTADDSALGKADAQLTWDASLQHFAATALTAHLDETTLNGDLKVTSFDAPAITFTLALDRIDLDRYLPPASSTEGDAGAGSEKKKAGAPGARGTGKASEQSAELPLEPLRQLNLNGKMTIGQLKAFNLRSRDVEVQIKADDGVLQISPLKAQLYEGAADVDLKLDVRKDTPRISVKEVLTGVQAGPLLKDLTGDDPILGKATVKADLNGVGSNVDEILKTLKGTAKFSFKKGAINGVNIAALIREAQAKLEGEPAPQQEQPNRTDFAVLRGSATVKNGLVKNDDLVMKSPLLRINGAGEVSLPKETIDYTLTTKFVGSLEGQGGKGKKKLKGVSIPVRVAGTFSQPSYTPDLAAVASEAAKAEVDKRLKKEKKKLQKKLGKDLPDSLLKDLLH